MSDRKPFNVTCGECKHTWVALYTPMEMGAVAKVLAGLRCPMCGTSSKKIFMGQSVSATITESPIDAQPISPADVEVGMGD